MELLSIEDLSTVQRTALVLVIAVAAHITVRGIRRLGRYLMSADAMLRWNKLRTIAGLVTSALVFALYFGALGFVLQEFGVSLTAYLASASILGLAIGFGSQGVVQDVVTGLTVILTDLFQVGDLVEISDKIGIVQSISMRFTILLNPLGATVYIPNRTLSSVTIYPRGYVRCFADITLSPEPDLARAMNARIEAVTQDFCAQFTGILRHGPEITRDLSTASGRAYTRVKFRIWPGRAAPIETSFRNEMLYALRQLDPAYADWMVNVGIEVKDKPQVTRRMRIARDRVRAGPAAED